MICLLSIYVSLMAAYFLTHPSFSLLSHQGLGLTHVLTGPIPVNMYSNYPTSFCSSFCFGIKIGICQTVGLIVVIASCSYLIFTSQHDYTSSSSSSYYTHISLSIRISKSIEHASQIGLGLYMICIGLSRFCLAFKRMHQLEDDHEEQIMFNADNEKHDTFSSFRNLGLGSSKTNLPRINSMLSINISQHCVSTHEILVLFQYTFIYIYTHFSTLIAR